VLSLAAIVLGACAYAVVMYGIAKFFSFSANPDKRDRDKKR